MMFLLPGKQRVQSLLAVPEFTMPKLITDFVLLKTSVQIVLRLLRQVQEAQLLLPQA
jgi:hypothetical protein